MAMGGIGVDAVDQVGDARDMLARVRRPLRFGRSESLLLSRWTTAITATFDWSARIVSGERIDADALRARRGRDRSGRDRR